MLDVEEGAGAGPVDDLVEGVGFGRDGVVEGDVAGREVVRVGVASGLVADVLGAVGGAGDGAEARGVGEVEERCCGEEEGGGRRH